MFEQLRSLFERENNELDREYLENKYENLSTIKSLDLTNQKLKYINDETFNEVSMKTISE